MLVCALIIFYYFSIYWSDTRLSPGALIVLLTKYSL